MNAQSHHKKTYIAVGITLSVVIILGVFMSFNPGNIFTKSLKSIPAPIATATTTLDIVVATTSAPMSVEGRYTSKDGQGTIIGDITFKQNGNILTFSGEAIYPKYDEESGDLYSANLGDVSGTTTLSINKAQLVITDYTYGEYEPCIIDFVFNNDKTLDISIGGDLSSCGWGHNVSFEGKYTKE